MKKLKQVMMATLLGLSVAIAPMTAVEASEPVDTFFIVPHPDDELLSLGSAILNHVNNGNNEVHLVLLTGGEESNVFEGILNMEERDFDFNRDIFQNAKINNFKRSAYIMGIEPENLHLYDLGDGDVEVSEVETIIRDLKGEFPNSRWKAMSYLDNHPDHNNSGEAVLNLHDEGLVDDARFYAKNSLVHSGWWNENAGFTPHAEDVQPEYHEYLDSASFVYKDWNPEKGFYSAGYKSVPDSFDMLGENPDSYYHLPHEEK